MVVKIFFIKQDHRLIRKEASTEINKVTPDFAHLLEDCLLEHIHTTPKATFAEYSCHWQIPFILAQIF